LTSAASIYIKGSLEGAVMIKKLNVGVYRLVLRGKPKTTLVRIVEAIQKLPRDESRTAMILDDPIRPRDDIRIK
jgi:hypothetical protein